MSVRRQSYPAYKDSGVPWLGDVPNAWEVAKLKSVAAVRLSGVDKKAEEGEIPVRFLSTKEVYNRDLITNDLQLDEATASASEWDAFGLATGDVVLTKDSVVPDNIAIPSYVPEYLENVICGYHLALLRPRRGRLVPKYLFWALTSSSLSQQFYAVVKGITIVGITTLDIRNSLLLVPPTSEQRAIAAFLDGETAKIDTLIRKQERLIGLLEEKRAALITHAVTKGLDPDVPMKDSDVRWLGKIPEQWDFAPLKYFVAQTPDAVKTGPFGSQLLSSEMTDGEIKVYNQRNVIDRDLTEGDNYISQDKFEELEAFRVCPGDILVTTRGTIGRCVTVPEDAELGILHPCLMRIDADPRRLLRGYLIYLIQDSFLVQTQLFLMSNATTIEVIYSSSLRQVLVPRPPVGQQVAIIDYLDRETARIDALIDRVRGVIDRLYEYRTALISAAVTGKIDVRGEVPSA